MLADEDDIIVTLAPASRRSSAVPKPILGVVVIRSDFCRKQMIPITKLSLEGKQGIFRTLK